MSYIGKQPAKAPLTSSDVADGIISNAKLAQDIISAETALGATPADTDEFLVSDAGTLKRMDYSHIKGGGGLVHIKTTNITSGTATVDFSHGSSDVVFDSTYNAYLFILSDVHPATDGQPFELTFSTDAGSSYLSSNYMFVHKGRNTNSSDLNHLSTSDSVIDITSNNIGGAADETLSAQLWFHKPSDTNAHKMVSITAAMMDNDGYVCTTVSAATNSGSTSAITGVRFKFGSGNIDRGNFSMFGVVNS